MFSRKTSNARAGKALNVMPGPHCLPAIDQEQQLQRINKNGLREESTWNAKRLENPKTIPSFLVNLVPLLGHIRGTRRFAEKPL